MRICNIEGCNKEHYGNGLCHLHYSKEYFLLNKEKIKETHSRWQKNNYPKLKEWRKKRIDGWLQILPKETQCAICNSLIVYNSKNMEESIHFDHRLGDELIKGNPSEWLRSHRCTEENIKIWKSCNFGMLCNACNRHFPVKSREEWMLNRIRYVWGEDMIAKFKDIIGYQL